MRRGQVWRAFVFYVCLFVVAMGITSGASLCSARETERKIPIPDDQLTRAASTRTTGAVANVFGVSQVTCDTFYYGGTVIMDDTAYAAAPLAPGWANRKMWSWSADGFNGTPHSGLNMDGWVGEDLTTQAEDYFRVADNSNDLNYGIGTCVLAGTKSLFCGVTTGQAAALCYIDQVGTGYGNNWNQRVVTKTYTYNLGDIISLSYKYHDESEIDFDYGYTILQTWDGARWINYDTLATYTGNLTGTATVVVTNFFGALNPPIDFRIGFIFASDGGYSDEDASNPTNCGGFVIDDYSLVWDGGATDSENFEDVAPGSLPAGWIRIAGAFGDYAVGDFAAVRHLDDLPIPVTLGQVPCVPAVGSGVCDIADSVLTFFDPNGGPIQRWHPLYQENGAISPIIDFSDHPGVPGRYLTCERFANLPMADYVFMQWAVRYAPACESGGWSRWLSNGYVYYTPEGPSCRTMAFDVSTWVPPDAQKAQVLYSVINECYGCPHVPPYPCCTYTNNVTPYFDNVSFGVYGSDFAPYISIDASDCWQDQFAEDGTLDPASTADTRIPRQLTTSGLPIFGDTLTCVGSADNMEVDFVFRMAKVGPRQELTDPFFTAWFPGITGGGWVEVRMDTAEVTQSSVSTVPVLGKWMCTFHEEDPVSIANGLVEGREILPNNLFVPGTRIEYFLKARYLGSATWWLLPDTTDNGYEEFEILPMMVDDGMGGLQWPCLIVADHYGQMGNSGERNSDRIARNLKAKNLAFDTFNRLGSAAYMNGIGRSPANPGQIGGPGDDKYNWGPGATINQMLAYTHCILNAGSSSSNGMSESDVNLIRDWLTLHSYEISPKFFWLSGDQVVSWLNGKTWARPFLNSTLGVSYLHANYAQQHNDSTYCLPMDGMPGGSILCLDPELFVIRENGCPRTFNCISTCGGGSVQEIGYNLTGPGDQEVAAVGNAPAGKYYKTFTEGYDHCLIRTSTVPIQPGCGTDGFMGTWLSCVLDWAGYGSSSICGTDISQIEPPEPDLPHRAVSWLGRAFPNPMNPTSSISYSVGKPGMVALRVFDVTGRVIRTLVSESKTPGAYSVIWDGTNDKGQDVGSGIFFYQLEASGFKSAKKIVILQ